MDRAARRAGDFQTHRRGARQRPRGRRHGGRSAARVVGGFLRLTPLDHRPRKPTLKDATRSMLARTQKGVHPRSMSAVPGAGCRAGHRPGAHATRCQLRSPGPQFVDVDLRSPEDGRRANWLQALPASRCISGRVPGVLSDPQSNTTVLFPKTRIRFSRCQRTA